MIKLSRTMFAQFGIPEVVVTDNGPCFVSEEFETFMVTNGVKHITSALYHPSTNGLAERAVQTVKKGLKKNKNGSLSSRLAKLLISYRAAPQSTTGEFPSQLLFGQQIRTRLDLIKPCRDRHVEKQQHQTSHDRSAKEKVFYKGERVYVRNFGTGTRWLSAVIEEVSGPVSYVVRLGDSRLVRRHAHHMEVTKSSATIEGSTEAVIDDLEDIPNSAILTPSEDIENAALPSSWNVDEPASDVSPTCESPSVREPSVESTTQWQTPATIKSYPRRQVHPPDRYTPGH